MSAFLLGARRLLASRTVAKTSRRFLQGMSGLLLHLSCLTSSLHAQKTDWTPVFLLQPGMMTTDFISERDGTSSATGLNVRFATLLPTRYRWVTPIAGVNVTPYGTTGYSTIRTNAPSVFAGHVFPLVSSAQVGGWLRVDVPLLWYYAYDGGGRRNQRVYGRDLYVELAFSSPLGEKLLEGLGPNWERLDAYLWLDQNLTPNPDGISSRTDRFNPIALFGMTLRFGRRL